MRHGFATANPFLFATPHSRPAPTYSAFLPIFYLADGGLSTIQTSQAGSMTTNGAPNDLLANFNPLTIIVMAPVLNYGVSTPPPALIHHPRLHGYIYSTTI